MRPDGLLSSCQPVSIGGYRFIITAERCQHRFGGVPAIRATVEIDDLTVNQASFSLVFPWDEPMCLSLTKRIGDWLRGSHHSERPQEEFSRASQIVLEKAMERVIHQVVS